MLSCTHGHASGANSTPVSESWASPLTPLNANLSGVAGTTLLWPHLDAYIKSLRNVGKHLIGYHTPSSELGLCINFLKALSTLCLWLSLTYHYPSSLYSTVFASAGWPSGREETVQPWEEGPRAQPHTRRPGAIYVNSFKISPSPMDPCSFLSFLSLFYFKDVPVNGPSCL